MLPTFVLGLREGVEASLVVGIIAAFLRQGGHRAALRAMWAGVILALVLCVGVAVGLQVLDQALPQQKQEALETVVASAAVGMVTFMIVWMRRHAATLAADLRASAAVAVASRSAWALVAMAVLAVMREGMETAVFMLAAFQVAPLGEKAEHDPVPLTARKSDGELVIPADAHIREASHVTNGSAPKSS